MGQPSPCTLFFPQNEPGRQFDFDVLQVEALKVRQGRQEVIQAELCVTPAGQLKPPQRSRLAQQTAVEARGRFAAEDLDRLGGIKPDADQLEADQPAAEAGPGSRLHPDVLPAEEGEVGQGRGVVEDRSEVEDVLVGLMEDE